MKLLSAKVSKGVEVKGSKDAMRQRWLLNFRVTYSKLCSLGTHCLILSVCIALPLQNAKKGFGFVPNKQVHNNDKARVEKTT